MRTSELNIWIELDGFIIISPVLYDLTSKRDRESLPNSIFSDSTMNSTLNSTINTGSNANEIKLAIFTACHMSLRSVDHLTSLFNSISLTSFNRFNQPITVQIEKRFFAVFDSINLSKKMFPSMCEQSRLKSKIIITISEHDVVQSLISIF
ncbi:hypothetical protein A3Q56_02007, partial [Intoshia linei]